MANKNSKSIESNANTGKEPITELERKAIERVRRARVKAPEEVILSFIRSTGGAESMLATKLCDIRAVANAF